MALRNNLELRVSGFGPAIAETSIAEAEALFDHFLTSRVSGGNQETPVGSSLQGATGLFSEDTAHAEVSLSRRLPSGGSISLGTAMDRTFSNSSFQLVNPQFDSTVGLALRQPLLRGAWRAYNESGIRAARELKDIADLGLRAATEQLVRNVEGLYWNLVFARGAVEVQEKSLAVAEDLLRVARARLEAGAGTRVEVSQAEARAALRRVDLLRARNDQRSGEDALLLQVRPARPEASLVEAVRIVPADDPAADLPLLPEGGERDAVEQALVARSDLRALRGQVGLAEIGVLRAASESKVDLSVVASARYSGLAGNLGLSYSDSMASREFLSFDVGLVLEVPLGNRAARARLTRAQLVRSQAEARLRAAESAAATAVRDALRDLESRRRQIDAAAEATRLAVEQLEAERERLRADKSTTYQVLLQEGDLTLARNSELRALLDYRVALARYDYERGRILESRGLR